LSLAPERRIGGIIASAGRVHQALSGRRQIDASAARLLREEIEAFCQMPAAVLPA
jgi:hypothetical protein